ncbi:MAG: hypothetical protein IIA14_09975 [SAR324 cluster bacterium]|nr:hypothetical protein [SAR324 cluster bacterium]
MSIPSGSRLIVIAAHAGEFEPISTRLTVARDQYVTYLSLDKPLYRPGETILYRSLTVRRFGMSSDRLIPINIAATSPTGMI